MDYKIFQLLYQVCKLLSIDCISFCLLNVDQSELIHFCISNRSALICNLIDILAQEHKALFHFLKVRGFHRILEDRDSAGIDDTRNHQYNAQIENEPNGF